MTEEEWLACDNPEPMLRLIGNRASARKLRYFAIICSYRAYYLIPRWYYDRVRREEGDLLSFIKLAEQCAYGALNRDKLPASPFPNIITGNQNLLEVAIRLAACPTGDTIESAVSVARYAALAVQDSVASNWTWDQWVPAGNVRAEEASEQTKYVRDIFGNPFRPVAFSPSWHTDTVVTLAQQMYDSRDFGAMPILADALQDAGCDNDDILSHCRSNGSHVRGCWVVDLVLGKE
jgi:hypothetical protein